MNEIRNDCLTSAVYTVCLSDRQLITLVIVDLVLLTVNVEANALVIYVLIKTEHLVCVSCKFILQLSSTYILIALLTQTLFIAVLFETKCSVKITSQFVWTFTSRVSGCAIALIARPICPYKIWDELRIIFNKQICDNVTTLTMARRSHSCWNYHYRPVSSPRRYYENNCSDLWCNSVFVCTYTASFYYQIHRKDDLASQTRINSAFARGRQKITRLCSRIMFLLVLFIIPFLVVNIVRNKILDQLNLKNKALLEFIFRFAMLFAYSNSIANATLFLISNSIVKRFLIRRLGLNVKRRRNNVIVNENQNIPHWKVVYRVIII